MLERQEKLHRLGDERRPVIGSPSFWKMFVKILKIFVKGLYFCRKREYDILVRLREVRK